MTGAICGARHCVSSASPLNLSAPSLCGVVARRTTPLPPKVPRPAEAQLSVPSHPESVVRVWGAFSVGILMLSPPPLCRRSRPGGGYRTCWIALSTARTGVRRALPRREGSLTARRSRPTPCRQPSTAAAGQGAQAASSSCLGMRFPTVASRAQSATVEVYHPPPRTHAWGACANGRIIAGTGDQQRSLDRRDVPGPVIRVARSPDTIPDAAHRRTRSAPKKGRKLQDN